MTVSPELEIGSSHADNNVALRQLKAIKIEQLMLRDSFGKRLRILEIGTGSGVIADYFSREHDVVSVDLTDQRVTKSGFSFMLVDGVILPFVDESFDFVISNHVIEHVGTTGVQLKHLAEIARVLVRGGRAYLATPNVWMINEPHYRLPFLSWFPRSLRDTYVRLMRKGNAYDVIPLSLRALERLFSSVDLESENITVQALKKTIELEKGGNSIYQFVGNIPDKIFIPFLGIMPTLIYSLNKSKGAMPVIPNE